VSRWQLRARPIALLIGGSHGLDDGLLGQARARWSLGPLTLPHELARVIALEQLYRAWTILRGEPYHKARRNR
jgi:23S rRNA (pseudouridine1915-N3)-methyltransferase